MNLPKKSLAASAPAAGFELRWNPRLSAAAWLLWLGVAAWLSAAPFLWHVEYFRSPGEGFYRLVLALIPALAAAVAGYRFLRRRGSWRWELAAIGAIPLLAGLFYQPRALAAVLAILISSYCIGLFVIGKLDLGPLSAAERIALASGVGLGAWSCLLFAAGLAGLYRPWVILLAIAAFCLLKPSGVVGLYGDLGELLSGWSRAEELRHPLPAQAAIFGALFAACSALVALAPALAYDALRWHLAAARHYAERGGLDPPPFLDYAYMPQGAESLMAAAHLLGGVHAAQLTTPLFFALFLLAAYALARRCGINRQAAVLGAACAASIPFLHWTGSVPKNDMALALYQLLALHCCLRAREGRATPWLQLGTALLALSFGIKHVAVLGALPIGALYLTLLWKQRGRLRTAVKLVLIFVALGLFWQARTYYYTGDPAYPVGLSFGIERMLLDVGGSDAGHRPSYLTIPWSVQFEASRPDFAFASPSDNPVGVFFVLFAPLWLLTGRKRRSPAQIACLVFCAAYVVLWGHIAPTLRYVIAMMTLLALFTAERLWAFYEASSRRIRLTLEAALFYSFLFALLVTMILEVNGPQLSLFAGRIDESEYLRRTLVTYRSLEFLQSRAGPDDLVLSVNNCSSLYAPATGPFHCIHAHDAKEAEEAIPPALAERRYEFLITPASETGKAARKIVAERYRLQEIYRDEEFVVFELRNLRLSEDRDVREES